MHRPEFICPCRFEYSTGLWLKAVDLTVWAIFLSPMRGVTGKLFLTLQLTVLNS